MPMRIKNWHEFQHFKDRNPPWIKLHKKILDQRDINLISDCSFRVLVGLWLLASEDKGKNGELPCVDDIAFRLRIEKTKLINALKELDNFLEYDDIKTISERYQLDVPETEAERETEAEAERETEAENSTGVALQKIAPKSSKKKSTRRKTSAKKTPPTTAVWSAYANAYRARYGTEPVRNKTINGQLANFVTRIPQAEAPLVAEFFIGHNAWQYVNAMHPIGLLLRDAEKLRTEWATQRQMTGTRARQVDELQTTTAVAEQARAIANGKRGES